MMWWNQGGWGAGEWLWMSVMTLVFWGGIFALVLWLTRRGRSTPSNDGRARASEEASELLAQRFARGELDEAQYQRSLALLRNPSGHA